MELEAITLTLYGCFSTVFQRHRIRANPEKNQKLRTMMPTLWPSYILVILTAFLGWVIPFGLPRLWRLIGASTKHIATRTREPAASNPSAAPISVRFHLAALLFLGFLGLALLGVPLLFSVRGEDGDLSSLLLVAILIPMVIALFYCLRKGDLSWSVSRAREEAPGEERSE
jgi:NADH:ubiquinone oxidoreductase subunit 3 (subunit A)